MKRASERLIRVRAKPFREKSPTVCYPSILQQLTQFIAKTVQKPPLHTALSHSLLTVSCILDRVEDRIEAIEERRTVDGFIGTAECLTQQIEACHNLYVQTEHSINCPEEQPTPIHPDPLCGGEGTTVPPTMQVNKSAPSSSQRGRSEHKPSQSRSVASLKYGQAPRKSIFRALVPLSQPEVENDAKISQLQTLYRERVHREQILQAQRRSSLPKLMQQAARTVNPNPREKEQYSYDYDGDKIPIMPMAAGQGKAHVKVLKTLCKVNKDKETKHGRKTVENIRPQKGERGSLWRVGLSAEGVKEEHAVKKDIEGGVAWMGKLRSLKAISERQDTLHA